MGASYLGGLAIYVLRIPERFKPGKFDLIVLIHNIIGTFTSNLALLCIHGSSIFICWCNIQFRG